MKTVATSIAGIVLWAVPALAAGYGETEEYGVVAGLLLGFASLIVSVKLIPGLLRLADIISEESKEEPEVSAETAGKPQA